MLDAERLPAAKIWNVSTRSALVVCTHPVDVYMQYVLHVYHGSAWAYLHALQKFLEGGWFERAPARIVVL